VCSIQQSREEGWTVPGVGGRADRSRDSGARGPGGRPFQPIQPHPLEQTTACTKTMPITYLDVPEGIRMEGKHKLVGAIYAALHEACPYPDDVRILLREWRPDSVSQDGQLASEPVRPVFMMQIPEGANIDAKRKMLRKINDAVVEARVQTQKEVYRDQGPEQNERPG
jgi:phenylpyruvate tautomerase PptA (4-oxalocrotonate tautomerase family)